MRLPPSRLRNLSVALLEKRVFPADSALFRPNLLVEAELRGLPSRRPATPAVCFCPGWIKGLRTPRRAETESGEERLISERRGETRPGPGRDDERPARHATHP